MKQRWRKEANIKRSLLVVFQLALIFPSIFSNNVTVTNIRLVGRDISAGANNPANFAYARFDVSWENSWRTSSSPNNRDAVWIFVKFRIGSGAWQHATLDANASNHTASTGSTITPSADGKGAFIYRSSDGTGTASFTGTELRWNYGADGVTDNAAVIVRIFAIEMVYVPQESFYAGDGTTTNIDQQFHQGGSVTSPFQITSEASLTLGGTVASNLGNNNAFIEFFNAANTPDDFDTTTTQTLPAAFPKGYNAFYCMKYELTQEQYVSFINMLDGTQQVIRISAISAGRYMDSTQASTKTIPQQRNGLKCITAPVGATPGVYGNDLNNNGIPGEVNDGQNLACNFLSWADGAAYLDWAGLRPMSELEFEKACRGPLTPVANEYAWGSTAKAMSQYTLSDSGSASEIVSVNYSTTGGNVADGNTNYPDPAPAIADFVPYGPLRVGIFADNVSNTGRITSGASYYGLMEMTGNNAERTISVGNATGRTFTGAHGDGVLLSDGNANVSNWPGTNAAGANRRGGRWSSRAAFDNRRVSDRGSASWIFATREYYGCIRAVRTAP